MNPADCRVERLTLEVAVEAFIAKNAQPPYDETELVAAGFIRSESDLYGVTGDAVRASMDSPCE